MNVRVAVGSMCDQDADAIVVGVFEGGAALPPDTAAVDRALDGRIGSLLGSGDFKGKLGDTVLLYGGSGLAAPRVLLVGLGRTDAFGSEGLRRGAASAALAARQRNVRRLATPLLGAADARLDAEAAAQALVEGAILAGYSFRAYKSPAAEDGEADLDELALVVGEDASLAPARGGAAVAQAVASGVVLARDLANHPGNVATPTYLAERAGEISEQYGLQFESWDRDRIVAEGMGAFASVARGSEEPPRFIVLKHAPPGTADQPPCVLVGKGLTFDAGGISLKPGLKMGVMKADMAGAAAVLGTVRAVAELALPLHVVALVSATENLPDGRATKPGDVVRARNGTTIEILNTDAEGRMVLADALCYAQDLRPAAVVDVATLTGAIVIALGHHAAGLFCNDDALAAELEAAAGATGERIWRLPIWDEYADLIKSDVADIKNAGDTSPSPAGSIFGAKFLERFVDYPWAHVDIAGMFWDAKDVPYLPKGATGFGVRLLVDWLRMRARA